MLGGMTYPENAVPPQQYAAQTPASRPQPAQLPVAGTALSNRWLLSLVTTSLGGYLLVSSLSGQVTQLLSGAEYMQSYGFGFGLLLVLNLLFALAVVLLGLFFATASLARRGIAAGIVVLGVILVSILQAVRVTAGFGRATPFLAFTFADPYVMLPLLLVAAWFVVRYRPGLAFVALALVIIIALSHWGLLVAGIDTATSSLVILLLSAIVTAAMGWGGAIASRLFGGNRAPAVAPNATVPQQYAQPQQAPVAHTQQNDRPEERGPVI
jgi:hypothetical protein